MLRKRQKPEAGPPSSSHLQKQPSPEMPSPSNWSLRSQWMFFAVASGACAAFNGVFAKL